jgi:hypothetical protein
MPCLGPVAPTRFPAVFSFMDRQSCFHAEPEQPRALTESELRMAFKLGVLRAIVSREVCSSYANGCVCSGCRERAVQAAERGYGPDGMLNAPAAPKQPWEQAA